MFKENKERLYIFLIFLLSFFLVFDLFFNKGHSAHMDGRAHITTITQFYMAIKSGDLRATWADGFANYGMPVPIVAHQLISYLGAWMTFLTQDVITSWKIVALIAAFLSNLIFYKFLRIYFKQITAFTAVFLYNVAPYRILNLFVREALPEFFASVFFPLVLLSLYYLIKEKKRWAILMLVFSITAMILSHPMMMVVASFIIFPYLLFLLKDEKDRLKQLILTGVSMVGGLLIGAYYLLPLTIEIKYFYYGSGNHLTPGQTLHLRNFIDPSWYYYFERDILNRGHFVTPGVFELIIFLCGVLYLIRRIIVKRKWKPDMLDLSIFVGVITLFLTTDFSLVLYTHIIPLSNIQFPWRMLSLFIFIPPLIVAYILNTFDERKTKIVAFCLIAFFALTRFPQLYSKNNTDHPFSQYMFTKINLHSTNMNTIWTGETEDYPVKRNKGEIIEGEGKILSRTLSNSWRKYTVDASTTIRMSDNTFYFPGWKVWVDNKPVEIQFQDPNYRGVITYLVPPGKHNIYLKFTNTKVRVIGNIISIVSIVTFTFLYYFDKKKRFLEKVFKYPTLN